MLASVHEIVRRVGRRLKLSAAEMDYLLTNDAEHVFEIELSGGGRHKAYRVQHNRALGPYKGGIRFHPEVDLDEARALAVLMSLKTAAVGLPLGGGKGGVAVDPKAVSRPALEELARAYVRHLAPHIGPRVDIPAPDVNTNAEVMDWMVDEYERLTGDTSKAAFTGKSLSLGGSAGRQTATGRGGVIVLREILRLAGDDRPLTIGVQGFGNVGSHFAAIAEKECPDWRLLGATDSSGGIYKKDGLKAAELIEHKRAGGRLADYRTPGGRSISSDDLLSGEVDVLALAALGGEITKENMHSVRASYILELANGPVDEAAHDFLTGRGVVVIPDVLANAGGVIVSYLEWLQNVKGERWSEARVNRELKRYLVAAADTIYNYAQAAGISLKEAAYEVAAQRIIAKRKGAD